MKILHNTRQTKYRKPFGALTCSETVKLRVEVDKEFDGVIEIRLWIEDSEEFFKMKRISERFFEFRLVLPEKPGHVWYYFVVRENGNISYLGNRKNDMGGEGEIYFSQPPSFQISISDGFVAPKWFKNCIMYQIFPDSFCNGNKDGSINNQKKGSFVYGHWENIPSYHKDENGDIIEWGFYGGNIQGIISKLDYIKSLGVGAIYLNPIFEAASPHRYDTGDYMKLDGVLGTLEDFEQLIVEAEKLNIGIILDGVFSHTGADSKYFNKKSNYDSLGAFNSPDSPYYRWYTFKEYPNSYECWWGVDDLPNVKEMNKSFRQFIYEGEDSVIRYWIRKGVKGFRLDVADELPEEFIRGIRRVMYEENPEAVLLGEVWEDASKKVAYGQLRNYFEGDQLHGVMNYPFYRSMIDFTLNKINAYQLEDAIMSIYENYPMESILSSMNLIGSHDRERILTVLKNGNKELYKKRLFMLIGLQMCLPGVPSIYYGDEAGLEGGLDPYNRGTYPWGREDIEILEFYRKITNIRNNTLLGSLDELPQISVEDTEFLTFSYKNSRKEIFVLVNSEEVNSKLFNFETDIIEPNKVSEIIYGEKINKTSENKYEILIEPLKTLIVCVTLSQ